MWCYFYLYSGNLWSRHFYKHSYETFFTSPALLFLAAIGKDEKFATAVQKNPQQVLQPLLLSLKALVKDKPDILELASKLENLVQKSICGIANGGPYADIEEIEGDNLDIDQNINLNVD